MARTQSLPNVAVVVLGVALGAVATPVRAETLVYTYAVEHPTFGRIGTYTNVIVRSADRTHVSSVLHTAVRILGFVVYSQDATRSEEWRRGRLISFRSVTTTNGKSLDISGKAHGNTFVITTPAGTTVAPADVRPSNPWSSAILKAHVMMSTKTGLIEAVHVTGGDETAATFNGTTRILHRYVIDGRKRGVVWLDNHGVPIAFKVWEQGTPIELVLISPAMPLAQTAMAPR